MEQLLLTPLRDIPIIRPGDDLADIILHSLDTSSVKMLDGDILVIAQKIVSKAEGRLKNLFDVLPTQQALELAEQCGKDARLVELILQESEEILRVRPGTIIVVHKKGFVCANAGIDHSNVAGEAQREEDWVLMLPRDPDNSARELRAKLESRLAVKIGILIIDSHGRAWRTGTTGASIGLSGLPGLVDLRGEKDLFGYTLQITQVAAADELAAAASLVMGQADEATPVIHVRGFPYDLRDGSLSELIRPKEQDLFR